MRITIIANCQARPVAEYVRLLGRDVEIVDVVITHLAKEADAARLDQAAAKSDFVFAQLVQPNYPVQFLRSAILKERYGNRVVLWPNVFFKGQTPDLCYVTGANGGRVIGPLGDYHSRPIIDAWLAGQSVDDTERRLLNGDFEPGDLRGVAGASLEELRLREHQCDVVVVEAIRDVWQHRRCFFTFNHPLSELLLGIAERLLTCADMKPALHLNAIHVSEPLCQFVPPMWPAVADALGLEFPTSTSSRGVPIDLSSGRVRSNPGVAYYTPSELIQVFFGCYEAQRPLLEACRFT